MATVARLFGEGRHDHPVFAPSGDSLAYVAKLTGRAQVYIADRLGRGAHALTSVPGSNSSPSWSPDGRWIAYATIRTGDWDIWLIATDGSFDRPLTADAAEDQDPAVSPDGRRLVFSSRRGGLGPDGTGFDLWMIELPAGEPARLTRSDGDDRGAAWSPDGTAITFHRVVGDSTSFLLRYDLQATTATTLTDPGGALDQDPAWSRDGRALAFASTRAGSWDLWLLELDAEPLLPRQLTASERNDRRPTWSPAARAEDASLVFVSDRPSAAIWRAWRLFAQP